MSEQPDSALVAAQRIHDRHAKTYIDVNYLGHEIECCEECTEKHPCADHADAVLVVERIRLAAEHLQAIIERSAPSRPHHDPGDDYRDALDALAALTGDTHA